MVGLRMVELSDLRANRNEIMELGARHGARNIRVFGSVVRGETHAHSDIDFLIDLDPARTLLDWSAFWQELESLLGRTVDVATEKSLKPSVRETALAEAVPL
jgi:uncharacterized protein